MSFLSELKTDESESKFHFGNVSPVYQTTLGELVEKLQSFRQSRKTLLLPDMEDGFTKRLYATYLSFLPTDDFYYQLDKKSDDRGSLAEFIKSQHFGQIFVSRTKPGITRGDHYHHTKVEKFLVIEGQGVIRFRNVNNEEIISYEIDGKDFRVVDIPPGYTHSIENVGTSEMIVLFWASEIFDHDNPDTIYLPVLS